MIFGFGMFVFCLCRGCGESCIFSLNRKRLKCIWAMLWDFHSLKAKGLFSIQSIQKTSANSLLWHRNNACSTFVIFFALMGKFLPTSLIPRVAYAFYSQGMVIKIIRKQRHHQRKRKISREQCMYCKSWCTESVLFENLMSHGDNKGKEVH